MSGRRNEERPSVLVLQAGTRAGPWACRSLRQAGYRVVAAHEEGDGFLSGWSRYGGRPLRYPSVRTDPAGFLATVEEICRREPVAAVLPLSESTVHLLAQGEPDLRGAKIVGPDRGQYERLCDKAGLIETARAAGVATPAGVVVTASGPSGEWPPLPNVVKPRASATPTEGGVVYEAAGIATTTADRDAHVARIVAATGAALVQEQVVGSARRLQFVRTATGFHAVAIDTVRSYPRAAGMSSVSTTIPMDPRLHSAARALLEQVGYRGPGSIQVIERNGEIIVHDVNLRVIYAVGVSIAAGLDLPSLAVDDTLGRARSDELAPARVGQHYVWLTGELRALADALRRPSRDDRPARIAADLVLAAVSPRRVLDPFDLTDPLPVLATLAAGVRGARRSPTASA